MKMTRNERKEPVWEFNSTIKVHRMDNSKSFNQYVGVIKDPKTKRKGEILTPMGGIDFIIVTDEGSFVINCKPLIQEVFAMIPNLKAKRINLRRYDVKTSKGNEPKSVQPRSKKRRQS